MNILNRCVCMLVLLLGFNVPLQAEFTTKQKFAASVTFAASVGGTIAYATHLNNKRRELKSIKREARIARDAKQELINQVSLDQRTYERIYNVGLRQNFPYIHDMFEKQDQFINELLRRLLNNEIMTYRETGYEGSIVFEPSHEDFPAVGLGRDYLLRHVVLMTIRAEEHFLVHRCMQRIEELVAGSRDRVMELFYEVCTQMRVDPLTVLDEPTVRVEREIDQRMSMKFREIDVPAKNWFLKQLKRCYPNCTAEALRLHWDLFKRLKRIEMIKRIVLTRLQNIGENPIYSALNTLKEHVSKTLRSAIRNWQLQNLPDQGWTHQQNEHNVPKNQNELVDVHQVAALRTILNDLNLQVDRTRAAVDRERETWQRIPLDYQDCMMSLKTIGTTLNRLAMALDATNGPHTVGRCNVLLDDARGCCVVAWYALDGLFNRSV